MLTERQKGCSSGAEILLSLLPFSLSSLLLIQTSALSPWGYSSSDMTASGPPFAPTVCWGSGRKGLYLDGEPKCLQKNNPRQTVM